MLVRSRRPSFPLALCPQGTKPAAKLRGVHYLSRLGVRQSGRYRLQEPLQLLHSIELFGREQDPGRSAVLRDHNRLAGLRKFSEQLRSLGLELAERDDSFGDLDFLHDFISGLNTVQI